MLPPVPLVMEALGNATAALGVPPVPPLGLVWFVFCGLVLGLVLVFVCFYFGFGFLVYGGLILIRCLRLSGFGTVPFHSVPLDWFGFVGDHPCVLFYINRSTLSPQSQSQPHSYNFVASRLPSSQPLHFARGARDVCLFGSSQPPPLRTWCT